MPNSSTLRKNAWRLTVLPLLLFMVYAFALPLVEIVIKSLFDPGFTLEHYAHFFWTKSYLTIFVRTFRMAFGVTLISLLLGYPVAFFLASLKERTANLLKILIIVPFWVSILIRTFAWKVVLSSTGVINTFLMQIGLIDQPLDLLYNTFAVYIGMIHIELPFMILSLYGVMKNIDRMYYDAALSLGAPPPVAFFKVYFPLTLPGVLSGTLLVFIMSLGFYITPSMLGGTRDTMIPVLIESQINTALNWGLGSALSVVLLVLTLIIIVIYNRVLGVDKLGGPST